MRKQESKQVSKAGKQARKLQQYMQLRKQEGVQKLQNAQKGSRRWKENCCNVCRKQVWRMIVTNETRKQASKTLECLQLKKVCKQVSKLQT